MFYQDYSFDVVTTTTGIEIASLHTDKPVYHKGDPVLIDLMANNSGATQNVIIAASIKTLSDEMAAGLPLQSMHALTGTAPRPIWNGIRRVLPRAVYYVEVELQDGEGNLLDREVREFTLGVAAGEVTALKATPALFKIGNSVAVTLTFQNTGDVPITGTAYIQIAHTDRPDFYPGVHACGHQPGRGQHADRGRCLGHNGDAEGDYAILGYVSDAMQVLGSKAAAISTTANVYLPVDCVDAHLVKRLRLKSHATREQGRRTISCKG